MNFAFLSPRRVGFSAAALTVVLGVLSASARAELTFNAGARLSRDNNVNGSPDAPTKDNQRSDSYLSVNASVGYFAPLDVAKTLYFVGQVGATTAAYNRFSNLNSSTLLLSAGLYKQLSPAWSVQFTGRGFTLDTRQSTRDSNGLGATFELKNQLSETLWVKGIVDYEDSHADSNTFSYRSPTYGLSLGYLPLKDTFVNVGYSRARREFRSTLPFNTTTNSLYADLTQRLSKNWYLNGGYAFRENDSNIGGTRYTNHVVSVGLSFSF